MIDALKHTLYAGIGATLITAEKLEAGLQDLVKRGRLTAEEAKETARKISEESKKDFAEARSSLESVFDDLLKKSPVVRRQAFDELTKRLDLLEKEVSKLKTTDS